MCSLVVSLCSRDLLMTSLRTITHSAWFLDGNTSTCSTAARLGYASLKPCQENAVKALISGRGIFVSPP